MKKKKMLSIPLIISIIALVVGASFHGFRIHPENVENYNLGVVMGITMASIAGISFIAFVILLVIDKRRK